MRPDLRARRSCQRPADGIGHAQTQVAVESDIVYGSQTGNARRIAEKLALQVEARAGCTPGRALPLSER
jgi:sulfite reductase alpha subunit-like flavoprotein